MHASTSKHSVTLALAAGLAMALTACGGGGATAPGEAPAVAADSGPVAGGPRVDLIAGQKPPADTDGDGLPDTTDPYPATAQTLSDDPGVLELVQASTDWQGWTFDGLHVHRQAVALSVSGTEAVSGPLFAVFEAPDQHRLVPLEAAGRGRWLAPAHAIPAGVRAVFVVGPSLRSRAVTLRSVPANAALLAPTVTAPAAVAGGLLRLEGVNLDRARLQLGGQPLDLVSAAGHTAEFRVPLTAQSGTLHLTGPAAQAVPLTVERRALVRFDAAIADRHATLRRNDLDGYRTIDSRGWTPVTVAPHARPGLPGIVQFAAPLDAGPLPAFAAPVWPDESQAVVGPASMLAAAALDWQLHLLPRGTIDAATLKAHMADFLASEDGRTLAEEIGDHVRAGTSWRTTAFMHRLRQAFPPWPVTPAAKTQAPPAQKIAFETDLYEQIVFNITARGLVASDYYINFSVGTRDSSTCQSAGAVSIPAGATPASLCLENDNWGVASVQVESLFNGRLRLQQSHINPADKGIFNTGIVGGNFGGDLNLANVAFLKADDGDPLCGMRDCRIELLTGSFGPPAGSVSPREQAIIDTLRTRVVVEKLVIPALQKLVSGIVKSNNKCYETVFGKSPEFGLVLADFFVRVAEDSTPSGYRFAFEDTILRYLTALPSKGVLSDLAASGCFGPELTLQEDLVDALERTARQAAGTAGSVITAAAKVAETAIIVDEALNTPTKFAFIARPKASVTGVSDTINIDDPAGTLRIDGTRLGQGPGQQGENRLVVTPLVFLIDDDNKFVVHRVRPSQLSSQTADDPSLIIPVAELIDDVPADRVELSGSAVRYPPPMSVRLGDLRRGRIRVAVVHDGFGFSGFPSGLLRVPGPDSRLVGDPHPENLAQTSMTVGQRNRIQGYRLADLQGAISRIQLLAIQPGDPDLSHDVFDPEFFRRGATTRDYGTDIYFDAPDSIGPHDEVTYAVILYRGFEDDPIEVPGFLTVTSQNYGIVSLTDPGPATSVNGKDDRISMALLSDGLTTVEAEAEYDGPGGTGEVRLSWTDSDLFTPPAEGVELICEDPGEDDFCPFLLTVETRDGGQFTCGGNLRFVDPDDEDEEIEPKVVVFSNNGC